MRVTTKTVRPFLKNLSHTPAEIMAAGGTTQFARLTGHDAKRMYHLEGESLTDEELQKALKDLEYK